LSYGGQYLLNVWSEIEAFQANSACRSSGKVRYLALSLPFDWSAFEEEQRVVPGDYSVLLVYDGSPVFKYSDILKLTISA
jgi:hypothetical protein